MRTIALIIFYFLILVLPSGTGFVRTVTRVGAPGAPKTSLLFGVSPRESFDKEVIQSINSLDFYSITFADRRAKPSTESESSEPLLKSVRGKLVELKGQVKMQLTHRYSTCDKTFNYDLAEMERVVDDMIVQEGFRSVLLQTLSQDHQLSLKRGNGKFRSVLAAPSEKRVIELSHDRKKNVPIDVSASFLRALKVTTSSGRPRMGMSDKLRQIQKFVEIMDGLLQRSELSRKAINNAFRVVDMGSGMAYLTFATHAHFWKKYPGLQTCGVEARSKLVESTNRIARDLGPDFDGLRFEQGYIEDVSGKDERVEGEACDVLMALHACDTATDDAIFYGIQKKASIIVVAPCCHKEVRRQMDKAMDRNDDGSAVFGNLESALTHGIYRERTAEMTTDTMRALLLEMSGYNTQVFEFVGGEHTAKNVMIAAVRRPEARLGTQEELDCVVEKRIQLRRLAAQMNVETQKLALMCGEGSLWTSGPRRRTKRPSSKLQKLESRRKERHLLPPPPASHLDDDKDVEGADWRSIFS